MTAGLLPTSSLRCSGRSSSGMTRGVIQLVERSWSTARLVDRSRGSSVHCWTWLMDRAWVRLREAATADPGDVEVQLLTAELFVERWPTKAVKVSTAFPWRRRPRPTAGGSLWAAAASHPRLHRPTVRSQRQGGAAEVIALAELYMSLSMRVRAESLLERLVRDGSTSSSQTRSGPSAAISTTRARNRGFLDELAGGSGR